MAKKRPKARNRPDSRTKQNATGPNSRATRNDVKSTRANKAATGKRVS